MGSGSAGATVGDGTQGFPAGGFGDGAQGSVGDDQSMMNLSDAFGTGRGAYGGDAGMIGDFFGGGYTISASGFPIPPQVRVSTPIAGGDRRFKIAENNSPFPTDRVIFSYHHFANALARADGQSGNLDRYMFGFEKTFLDGLWSLEVRAPVVNGLNSDQLFDGANTNFQSTEFGNLAFALKHALYQGPMFGASIGLGIITPTADDARFFSAPNTLAVVLENEAVYFQPFFGLSYRPDDQIFSQLVVQVDVDARGNTLFLPFLQTQSVGVIQDQTLLYLDWSMGYWLFRNPGSRVSGIAPMIEVHYTSTLENSDVIDFNGLASVRNTANRLDVINLTGGIRTEFFGASYLTTAVVVPLKNGDDKLFDAELGVQFTRMF